MIRAIVALLCVLLSGSSALATTFYGSIVVPPGGTITIQPLTSGQCVQTSTGGLLTITGSACGSGGGIITSVAGTAPVTASTVSGAVTVGIQSSPTFAGAVTVGSLISAGAGSFAGAITGESGGFTGGVSAGFMISTGSISGPAGVFSSSITDGGLTAGQCVQTGTGGLLTTTGSACGSSGGGTITAVAGSAPIGASTVGGTATIACATCVVPSTAPVLTGTNFTGIPDAALVTAPVTNVTASGNLASSGGTTPAITMTATPTFTSLSSAAITDSGLSSGLCVQTTAGGLLTTAASSCASTTGFVLSVSGTANQIVSSGGANPILSFGTNPTATGAYIAGGDVTPGAAQVSFGTNGVSGAMIFRGGSDMTNGGFFNSTGGGLPMSMGSVTSSGEVTTASIFNVTNSAYGAKCDNATDDHTAILNALAAANSVGGILTGPSGKTCYYNTATPLSVTGAVVNWPGGGIRGGASTTDGFVMNNTTGNIHTLPNVSYFASGAGVKFETNTATVNVNTISNSLYGIEFYCTSGINSGQALDNSITVNFLSTNTNGIAIASDGTGVCNTSGGIQGNVVNVNFVTASNVVLNYLPLSGATSFTSAFNAFNIYAADNIGCTAGGVNYGVYAPASLTLVGGGDQVYAPNYFYGPAGCPNSGSGPGYVPIFGPGLGSFNLIDPQNKPYSIGGSADISFQGNTFGGAYVGRSDVIPSASQVSFGTNGGGGLMIFRGGASINNVGFYNSAGGLLPINGITSQLANCVIVPATINSCTATLSVPYSSVTSYSCAPTPYANGAVISGTLTGGSSSALSSNSVSFFFSGLTLVSGTVPVEAICGGT